MKFQTNTILKDNDEYIIIKDYDKQMDFYICYCCNKHGTIIEKIPYLLKANDLKQMKIIKQTGRVYNE